MKPESEINDLKKYSAMLILEKDELKAKIERQEESIKDLTEALRNIIDLHECDPSFNSIEEQSRLEHKRFKIADEALQKVRR